MGNGKLLLELPLGVYILSSYRELQWGANRMSYYGKLLCENFKGSYKMMKTVSMGPFIRVSCYLKKIWRVTMGKLSFVSKN